MTICKKTDVGFLTGSELRAWRKAMGWNQQHLASELRVSRPTVSAWESKDDYIPRLVYLAVQALERLPDLRSEGNDGIATYGGGP